MFEFYTLEINCIVHTAIFCVSMWIRVHCKNIIIPLACVVYCIMHIMCFGTLVRLDVCEFCLFFPVQHVIYAFRFRFHEIEPFSSFSFSSRAGVVWAHFSCVLATRPTPVYMTWCMGSQQMYVVHHTPCEWNALVCSVFFRIAYAMFGAQLLEMFSFHHQLM